MLGRHMLADFFGVAVERLDDVEQLAACLESAARSCGLTAVAPPLLHRFDGGGVTGVILLAESHIAVHTFPEHGYAALDIFSCGDSDPHRALNVFRAALAPQREQVTMASRGVTPPRSENHERAKSRKHERE